MKVMDALRQWLGRPPDEREVEERLRDHERQQREHTRRIRSLEAQVRAATGDYDWRARRAGTEGDDAGHY